MAGIRMSWARGAVAPLAVMGLVVACPDEASDAPKSAGAFELPDRYVTSDAAVLVRLRNGAASTGTAVHRSLGRLFRDQVDAVGVLTRGGAASDVDAPDLQGTAVQQVAEVFDRVFTRKVGRPLEALDACGNPMVAAFLTPDLLAAALPPSQRLGRLVSDDAGGATGGRDTSAAGIFDVSLTEERSDGMLDAFVSIYPSVAGSNERPGFLGHLFGVFLTASDPGSWQFPLYVAAERVNVSVQGIIERHVRYTERHYGDERTVYRFPHKAREVATNDLRVTMLGDPLCDTHHATNGNVPPANEGSTPFGCKLPDGRDLPVMLDTDSELGAAVYGKVLQNGKVTTPLEDVADAMAWQVGAFLACPTFQEALFVADGDVEVLVCPELGPSDCVAFHDMEAAACDYADDARFPERVVNEVGDAPVALTLDGETRRLVPDVAGLGAAGMTLTLQGAVGQELVVATASPDRLTVRGPAGAVVPRTSRANTHCAGRQSFVWTLPAAGAYRVEVSGDAELELLATTRAAHLPR